MKKLLYVVVNLGCSGQCDRCPTKNTLGCSKLTVEDLIDWKEFERVIKNSKADTICLIGGENPFVNCSGHRELFTKIYNCVKLNKKELYAITGYKCTGCFDILALFSRVYVHIPKNWKDFRFDIVNTITIKGITEVRSFIQADEVNDRILGDIRRELFINPTILLETNRERSKIKSYIEKYKDFKFAGSLLQPNCPVYSLTENKLCGTLHASENFVPWRELIKGVEE